VIDLLVAAGLLLLLSPMLLIVALLVKLTSPGPVFFVQERGGWHGENFRAYKFRSMRGGRKPDPKELVPLDHPEITAVGKFIRRTKIDELPQLINVLKGEMAIIGPRPTLPDQVAAYDDFKRQRLLVRPGCTGLAQVNGATAISWDERIKYDVHYAYHCSPRLDLHILLKTVLVVLRGEAPYARPFKDSPYAKPGDADQSVQSETETG
jgi:lipopolysaccharide/colanic/teichoic acid biosynthesis glycosyltransferase